jgi:hypothetical protein
MARALLFRTIRYLAVKDERRVFFLLQLEACPSARPSYVVHGWVKGQVARSQEPAEPPRVVSAISMSDSSSPLSRKVQMRRVARAAYARVIVARRR